MYLGVYRVVIIIIIFYMQYSMCALIIHQYTTLTTSIPPIILIHYHCYYQDVEDEDGSECLLSFIAQLRPAGWVWESYGYQQAFLKEVSSCSRCCTVVSVGGVDGGGVY